MFENPELIDFYRDFYLLHKRELCIVMLDSKMCFLSHRLDRTYTKKSHNEFIRGSLNDVSSNPLGELNPTESTLRRSRSLAISRADIFTTLNIPNQSRRSQLIPRAKLVGRTTFKDR